MVTSFTHSNLQTTHVCVSGLLQKAYVLHENRLWERHSLGTFHQNSTSWMLISFTSIKSTTTNTASCRIKQMWTIKIYRNRFQQSQILLQLCFSIYLFNIRYISFKFFFKFHLSFCFTLSFNFTCNYLSYFILVSISYFITFFICENSDLMPWN